eukprot:s261_g4.t1
MWVGSWMGFQGWRAVVSCGHEGFSGTPLWKIREQYAAQREQSLAESLAYVAARSKPIIPPNILVDGISMGGQGGSKPFTRHALVADRTKVDFPMTGLFADQAPIGLYALFDGQSSASSQPGHLAAEYCAKNFHKKVMDNISSLPANCTSETYVKAALVKSFEDLDKEILETQPDIQDGVDGCGAAVALIIGDVLFSAVLGLCDGLLFEVDGKAVVPAEPTTGSGFFNLGNIKPVRPWEPPADDDVPTGRGGKGLSIQRPKSQSRSPSPTMPSLSLSMKEVSRPFQMLIDQLVQQHVAERLVLYV